MKMSANPFLAGHEFHEVSIDLIWLKGTQSHPYGEVFLGYGTKKAFQIRARFKVCPVFAQVNACHDYFFVSLN